MNGAATTRVGDTGLTTERIRANYLRVPIKAGRKPTRKGREAFSARLDSVLRGRFWTTSRPSLLAGSFQPKGNQSLRRSSTKGTR
jgi:hypothetical protein